jgi:mono/diheme cytochrome c family protein
MHRLALVGLGIALLSGVASPSSAAEPADPVLAPVGAEMFQQYCAACHGTGGEGNGPVAPALKQFPADLTRIAARNGGTFPDSDVARRIDGRFDVVAHGTTDMPVWGRKLMDATAQGADENTDAVVRGRILTIVEYLKTIQKK